MNEGTAPGCDLLIVSPHTDDLEIGLGGSAALLADRGRRVWGLDLTAGELGSNATPQERWTEAEAASEVLGLTGRIQLALPDGFVDSRDRSQLGQVVAVLRSLRPRWVAAAPDARRHPDHLETPELVRRACFLARLAAWQPQVGEHRLWQGSGALVEPAQRWQTEAVLQVCRDDERPALLFDISGHWERKTQALGCYASQFRRVEGRLATMINDPSFLEKIDRRTRTWGRLGGVERAEALRSEAVPVYGDLPGEAWSW